VGKGPLRAALKRFHPEPARKLNSVVLYNDRAARPGEQDGVDYHFRRRDEIEQLRGREGFLVMEVRGDLQAVDLNALEDMLVRGDAFFEGNPFVGHALLNSASASHVERMTVFLSPLSKEELLYLQAPERSVSLQEFVTDVMRPKLLRRTTAQKGRLSQRDLEDIERRASSAYAELKLAHHFDHVLPNHDGEDSENWNAFPYPLDDARKALLAFVDLLRGRASALAETWEEGDPV